MSAQWLAQLPGSVLAIAGEVHAASHEAGRLADTKHPGYVMANPPFGTKIKVEGQDILEQFDLAHAWTKSGDKWVMETGFIPVIFTRCSPAHSGSPCSQTNPPALSSCVCTQSTFTLSSCLD